MGKVSCGSIRSSHFTICAFFAVSMTALFTPSAFMQQQGGPYAVDPSVIPGGGGTSSNGNTRIEGSIGQHTVSASTGGFYTIEPGFWPDAAACPFAQSPGAEFFAVSGGSGSVNVIAATDCSWLVAAGDSWITITSNGTGSGNDTVTFEARENFTSSARQASINISGLHHTVVQDGGLGEDCGYSISPLFKSFPAQGGSGMIQVIAAERCAWQAVSSVGWVTITSVSVGIGDGTLNYSLAANPGVQGRKGTIIIGGQAFAVKQKGN